MGCGDIGRRVAKIWLNKDIPVAGFSRSAQNLHALQQAGIEAFHYDLDDPLKYDLNNINVKDSVLYYFAPPPASGKSDTRMAGFLSRLEAVSPLPILEA